MIFWPDLAAKVANGTKTQTRRHKLHYEIGKDYAVQPGRGKHSLCRIRITGIRHEPLGQISDEDILAEGFANFKEFYSRWTLINGLEPMDTPVVVYEFEKVS